MLAILIIILVLLWAAVVWSIYSNFLVFYSNFSETENYHKAYYASISALERWELVTKQRQPWYVWSGGFKNWMWTWSIHNSDWWSDRSLSWFSYFWDNKDQTSVFRTVNSRTKRIPAEWKWDVERMLSYNSNDSADSNNYNMMDYENAEVFLLYYDTSLGNPYKNGSTEGSNPTQITWEIRLPKLLYSWFWDLDVKNPLIVWTNLPWDDPIVDRQIRWFDINDNIPFTVYSTTDQKNVSQFDKRFDSVFRESDINTPLQFKFWNSISPISSPNGRGNQSELTVISPKEDLIKNEKFSEIFQQSWVQLRFALLNLVQWSWSNWKNIYPFLEYYADFWTGVSDKYYTINAEWNFKDFQVNIIIQKPTIKETVLWNFTSIF